jgi:hypothetical protein
MKKFLIFMAISLAFEVSYAQWATNGTNIYNSNTGNVGVGTGTPIAKFQVISPSHDNGILAGFSKSVGTESMALNLYSYLPTPTTNTYLDNTFMLYAAGSHLQHLNVSNAVAGGTIRFLTGGWDSQSYQRMIIDGNGRVGIGKAVPAYSLDVNGIINATALYVNGTSLTNSQWTTTGSNINFNSGIVSIGTATAPAGYKLAIGGKMVAEEVVIKLQTNWPDYVFEPTYELPPLAELETFILTNKHLPGVPTDEEVKKDGVSVGEMNTILLKKVEELTLYLIDLKKENDLLKNKLEEVIRKME